jgi:hypothetical protein
MMKSIVISTAAALIGPAIGIAIFFTAHSNHLGGATTLLAESNEGGSVAVLGKDEAIKTFVPQWLLIDAFPVPAPQRMPYAVNGTAESGTWRTVVRCALGPATKDGRCPLPEASEAIADIDSAAEASNLPPLSGRMFIGGP